MLLAGLKVSALLIFIALGFTIGAGSGEQPGAGCRSGRWQRVAARADPGDVHLLGLERCGVRGRRDPRSGTQRAARARHRHAGGGRDLRPAQPAVPLRAAGRRSSRRSRAASWTSSPTACSARAPATSWPWSRSSASPPASARWCSPGPRVYYAMAQRRRLLQERRAHPSALPHARGLDRRPVDLERSARALRQRGCADDLHRLLGRAVRRCRRALAVRPEAARARCAATLQGDRLSPSLPQSLRSRARSSSATRSTRISSCRCRHGTAWGPAAAGLIVIGLGLPVYLVFRRRS